MGYPDKRAPRAHARRKLLLVVACSAGFAFLLLAWLRFGPGPNVPKHPVKYVRGPDGRMVAQDESLEDSGGLEMHAGKIQASNSLTSTCTTSRSGNARFACRNVAVFLLSDELLLNRVGQQLLEHLKSLGCIDQLDYYPPGFFPAEGEQSPDVVLTLDLAQLSESGFPGRRRLDAEVVVTAGRRMAKCRSSYMDHLTPPVVDFGWRTTLSHKSTTVGVATSTAKYKLAAEDMAKQIAKAVEKLFDDFAKEDGMLPDLPSAFWPPYRPAPAWSWMQDLNVQRVSAYHGLMSHNDTVWRIAFDGDLSAWFASIEAAMSQQDWRTDSMQTDLKNVQHLRMSHGAKVMVLFPAPANEAFSPRAASRQLTMAHEYYLFFNDRMTREEVESAMDEALANNAPLDVLLLFESTWSKTQCRRILERMETEATKSSRGQLAIANIYHRLKEDDKSREALQRADILAKSADQSDALFPQIKSLAKKLEMEAQLKQDPSVEQLKEIGFVELQPDREYEPVQLGIDEPVLFFGFTADGSLKTVAVQVTDATPSDHSRLVQIAYVIRQAGSRSWGRGGTTCGAEFNDRFRATFSYQETDQPDRFLLRTTLAPKSADATGD
jgi:hypothetical protein